MPDSLVSAVLSACDELDGDHYATTLGDRTFCQFCVTVWPCKTRQIADELREHLPLEEL